MRIEHQLVRRLNHWARGIVLAETGQPVDLVHIEELDGTSRAFVELPSGIRTYVPLPALTNRLARMTEGALTLAGVALAGMLLGYALGLPEDQRLALTGQQPAPVIGSIEG